MRTWLQRKLHWLVREFDAPSEGRALVMIGGHYVLAPWEDGGPVATKPTYWVVIDGVGLRIPRRLYHWLGTP